MFVAIGGKVYKYDLVSKECLFEFNTFAHQHMQLYDYDDKLLVADRQQLRLWDFFDHKEEIPELVTVLQSPLKIECIKVNKQAEEESAHKDVYYYVVTSADEFKIYHGRLMLLLEGDIGKGSDKITSIEFGLDTACLYLGTEKGFIRKYELPSPQQVAEEYDSKKKSAPRAKMIGDPFRPEEKTDYDYSIA